MNSRLVSVAVPVPALEKPEPKSEIAAGPASPPSDDETSEDDHDMGGDEVDLEDGSHAAEAPPPAAAKAKPGASKLAPAQRQEATAVYMTDKELLEMQGRSDDGEVAE